MHPTIGLGAAVLAAILTVALPGTAFGATITVNTTVDAVGMDTQCSLREAITAANDDAAPFGGPGECAAGAGPDRVVLPPGRFELELTGPPEDANATGDLDVGGTQLLVTGAGAGASVIDANGIDRVLEVLTGQTLTIELVTLTGGHAANGTNGAAGTGSGDRTGGPGTPGAPGGGIANAGSLAILDSTISDNRAGDGGTGGSGQGAAGEPPVAPAGAPGSIGFGGNGGGGGDGGGIYNAGNLAMTRVTVVGNTAGKGGVGGFANGGQGGFGTASESGPGGAGFGGFGAIGGMGGGVASAPGASVNIDRSLISGNTSGAGGNGAPGQGGLGGPNSEVRPAGNGGGGTGGNAGSGGNGGGVGAVDSLVLTRSLIEGNSVGASGHGGAGTGGNGGGHTGSAAAGTGGNGSGGRGGAAGDGAGVWTGEATIANTTVTLNQSRAGGQGGLGDGGEGANSISGPDGPGGNGVGGLGGNGSSGGGVRTVGNNTTVSHATITGNTVGAAGFGGSASGGGGGGMALPGTAGSQGPGAAGAGGALASVNPATLANSIAASNAPPTCSGTVTDGGHNIVFPDATCPGVSANPQLDALADNGGPTRTQAVGPGSPAFDAVPTAGAGCAPTDQRGVTRPRGQGCEIGAYEHAGPDATTGDATAISGTGATLQGEVNPNGSATSHHFEFGTTTAYGSATPSQNSGSGIGPVAVSAAVAGLTADRTYHYRLVATNANGTAFGADRTFRTVDTTRPRILAASVKPKVFAVLRRGRATSGAKKGTTFRYRLSEAARVRFTIHRVSRGRRVGRRCRKETRANRSRRACKRFVRAGRPFAATGRAGRNSKKFSGRLGKRALSPARYRATLIATDAAGNASTPKRLTFRIVRR